MNYIYIFHKLDFETDNLAFVLFYNTFVVDLFQCMDNYYLVEKWELD